MISGRCSRRGAIAGAFALGSLPTAPVLAQTEVQAAVAAREAAEAAERDPLNRLKGARVTLASITDQLSGENPDLGVVRAALSPSKPQRIAGAKWEKSVEGVAYAVRTYTKEVAFKENADVGPLRVQLLAQIKDIDQIVYDNQAKSPSVVSGYCAAGVVPRDEPGACKVKPQLDVAPVKAKVEAALKLFDSLLAKLA